jgi:GMP synthase (glutamine-hydrolysing)
MPPLKLLVAESEAKSDREARRRSVGKSSGETYLALLRELSPGAVLERLKPADVDEALPSREALAAYDGVVLTGSPVHAYEDTPEAQKQIAFMRDVFAAGLRSFGSCAGLQVAVVAAGGKVRPCPQPREAGFARRITATPEGLRHPLLAGRPAAWDAPAIHSDEVETLPDGAVLLACNSATRVQAVEIRCGEAVFWGVQYHPELTLQEVSAALQRQADTLIQSGLAADHRTVQDYSDRIDRLAKAPERLDLAWALGLDEEVAQRDRRCREVRNFLAMLAS